MTHPLVTDAEVEAAHRVMLEYTPSLPRSYVMHALRAALECRGLEEPPRKHCECCEGRGVVGDILDTARCPHCDGSGYEEPDAKASLEEIAQFLWGLLDDIDTASDEAKANDHWYRRRVEHIQRRRFEVGTTDGYTVTFKARQAAEGCGSPYNHTLEK